jgi:hypothetical protein
MKSTTTMFQKVLIFGAMVWGMFQVGRVEAQTPCTGQAAYGCGGAYGYGGDITDVAVKNSAGTVLASYSSLGCSATNAAGTYRGVLNAGAPIDLTAGEEITIEITGTSWIGYNTRVGVWMDVSLNYSFEREECVVNPGTSSQGATMVAYKVKVPCFTKAGGSFMRIRGANEAWTTMNNNQGCGNVNSYGNVMDIAVNYKLGPTPVANFVVPSTDNWERTYIKFPANNPNAGATYTWKFDKNNGVRSDKSTVGEAKWDAPGTYEIFMKVDYCGIADSTSKTVTIVRPSAIPVADFIAAENEVEQGYTTTLFDLSSNGAYKWDWEIYSPSGDLIDAPTDQNPEVIFFEAGMHEVCLTSENFVGQSSKVCKSRYIECLPSLDNYMGPQKISATRIGRLFDHAGPSGNYANGRRTSIDYFKILPCGATEIRLKFNDLDFADDKDILKIYDGPEENPNTRVATISRSNQRNYDSLILKLTSGAAYLTFESDGANVGRGFAISWESDLETPTPPKAAWSTPFTTVGVGVQFFCTNETSNAKGNPDYEWRVNYQPQGFTQDFAHTLNNNGTYRITLLAKTCTGVDSFSRNITIITPTSARSVDFVASNVRPNIGDVVRFRTTTDYANRFEWSIFPTTFKYVNGTSNASQNPQIEFLAGGEYTFTLSAWNGAVPKTQTDRKVIKNKYVICLNYCTPLSNLVTKDISINKVKLTDRNKIILIQTEDDEVAMYTDRTDKKPATMTYGAAYDLEIQRLSSANDINYKVWIDWNIDGDFDDAGEEVLTSGKMSGNKFGGNFRVPALKNSFLGTTRMRIGASYDGFPNRPCGVNQVGEYEDFAITLVNDGMPPQIQLVGSDTVRVERSSTAKGCYEEVASTTYLAIDGTEGDITSNVVLSSDLDCRAAGVYSIDFNLEDASGNKAQTKTRTIIVVLDRTGPVMTLQGSDVMTVEQCGTFTDPGAVAIDAVDGDLTTAILVKGSVDASKVGDYELTYSAKDAQGNETTVKRMVRVRDTQKPGIYRLGNRITNGMTINVQINQAFVDDIYAMDPCNGNIQLFRNPGYNGVVNNQERATYPIVYNAADPSGNKADEDSFTINYVVDDFIAPNIELNTNDTIYHNVNDPYSSRSVTVTDNYYAPSQVSLVRSGRVDPFTLGTYVETFVATDASGNRTTKNRYIQVVDMISPVIVAPAVAACVGVPFWAESGLILSDNYWSKNDITVNVIGHNINIFEPGIYSIEYQAIDGSGNRSNIVSRTVYVQYPPNCMNTFLSNEKMNLSDAVNVHPNPTSGNVTVSYALNNNEPMTITVFNSVGALMMERVVGGNFGETQLDLSGFGNGIYMVRMSNNGQSTVKKVIVKD